MFEFPTSPQESQQAQLSPGLLAALLKILGAPSPYGHQLRDGGRHTGPVYEDGSSPFGHLPAGEGPVGENSQLGWGTAPPMRYPQKPAHQAPPAANYSSAAHARPPASHTYHPQNVQYFDSPPIVQGTQNVAIQGPYGSGLGAGMSGRPKLTPAQVARLQRRLYQGSRLF